VLIVDDHPAFRESSRALLESEGFAVVGEAADGESALKAVQRLHPDVVLLDVQLPGLDGFEVAERIAAVAGPPAVVLVSSRSAASYGPRLARAAAVGFIAKVDLSGESLSRLLAG
jgi:two-component system response regulator EvgA